MTVNDTAHNAQIVRQNEVLIGQNRDILSGLHVLVGAQETQNLRLQELTNAVTRLLNLVSQEPAPSPAGQAVERLEEVLVQLTTAVRGIATQ